MARAERSLVVDANILIRAVLGQRVYRLIDSYSGEVEFFTPQTTYEDATKHLPEIAGNRGLDVESVLTALEDLRPLVWVVADKTYEPLRSRAFPRIAQRDPDDWTVLATALALDCPIWTEDRDFFGTGVPTWTTERVELYLRGIE